MTCNIKKIVICICIIIVSIFTTSCNPTTSIHVIDKGIMEVNYINVGQGDCSLIQLNNENILIDAGPEESIKATELFLKNHSVKKINYCIATHPHEDHIGGLSRILKDFKVEKFYAPKITSDSECFKNMVSELKAENLRINIAKAGIKLNLGKSASVEFLAPNSDFYTDLNDYSVVLKLTYGNTKFLFDGDAQNLSEKEILEKGYDVSSDVLKVGHHGSKTSTSQEFLSKATPIMAIISCGLGNDYGHPNKITINKLKKANCKIYSTYIDGNITIISDGKTLLKK